MSGAGRTVISVMDIGGTHVTAANVDLDARAVVPGQSFRVPLAGDVGAEQFVATLVGCARLLPRRAESRWSLALPGPFDYERGVARYAGVGKFDALNGFDLRAALLQRLPGVITSVSFHGDADAFFCGERWAGAARGHDTAIGITLGTGVGSCFLSEGRVVRAGPGIPPEGRVDLLRHAGMPLEDTVSRRALRRAYAQLTGASPTPDVHEIAQRARRGDGAAAEVFKQACHALGTVLAPSIAVLDPTIVVVGGSIAGAWDLVAEPLRAGLAGAAQAARTVLAPAANPDAALLGAARLGGDPA